VWEAQEIYDGQVSGSLIQDDDPDEASQSYVDQNGSRKSSVPSCSASPRIR